MGLFGKKHQPAPQPKQIDKHVKVYRIPYSKGFRGFKKFPIVMHGIKDAEANQRILHDKDISNSTFEFVCMDGDFGVRFARFYIDGMLAGAVYDAELVHEIENVWIEQIHAEPDAENIISSTGTETRLFLRILVKKKGN